MKDINRILELAGVDNNEKLELTEAEMATYNPQVINFLEQAINAAVDPNADSELNLRSLGLLYTAFYKLFRRKLKELYGGGAMGVIKHLGDLYKRTFKNVFARPFSKYSKAESQAKQDIKRQINQPQ